MNALATTNTGTALAMPAPKNAFEAYAEAVGGSRIVGELLKFNKGDWLVGKDGTEIKAGTRLVAAVEELLVGWLRWEDKKVSEIRMGRVADGFMPAARRDLGDLDDKGWPLDDEGRPQDPWQCTSYLILKEEHGDQLYTYAPSSAGGRSAIGELTKAFGQRMRTKPNEFPVIELGVDKYKHKDVRVGWVKTPVLKPVAWVGKAVTMAAIAGEAKDAEADAQAEAEREESPATPASTGKNKKTSSGEVRF